MSAAAIEVQKDKWPEYFRDLGKEYQGWAVTIEFLDPELGDQLVADGVPFQGISFETNGSAAGDVLVEVGDIGTPYEVHRINRPRAVRGADIRPGVETDVQIESMDGTTRVIHLRLRPALPGKADRAAQARG